MLTARGEDEDIIRGLKLGADDYIAEPLAVVQLELRVKAVLQRTWPMPDMPTTFSLGDGMDVDAEYLHAQRGRTLIALKRSEMEILQYLAAKADRQNAVEKLLHRVWICPKRADIETRIVAIHIAKLRRKMDSTLAESRLL